MTHSKDGKLLSEKKLRRLEKNRLSARECRRRKREATENMQREINVLEGENLRLRLQLKIGDEAEESSRQEQARVIEDIGNLTKSGASEAEIYATIEEFKAKFADFGRDRRSAIEFHLKNVERLLMPTQVTTVAMRTLHGSSQNPSSDFFEGPNNERPVEELATVSPSSTPTSSVASLGGSNASTIQDIDEESFRNDPKALFGYLVKYLEVTSEQAAALKDSRFVAQELDSCLENALGVLEELKTRMTQCGEDLETEFDNVRGILTPTQSAKFLLWVSNNNACMHMLNELWDRLYANGTEDYDGGGGGGDTP